MNDPLFRGDFRIDLKPDGTAIVPDLAEPLIPLLRNAGADESLWRRRPCAVSTPAFIATRQISTDLLLDRLDDAPSPHLWNLHRRLMEGEVLPNRPRAASLMDLKLALARRLLAPCLLCERRCRVDRSAGELGFCGLGAGIQVAAHAMLYNEGPLVGAPTFAVFLRGCSLRCSYCYRPDELQAKGREEWSVESLADALDRAASAGAESWHFLGGNPDESLPGVLQALALTKRSKAVVWNSALMLTPPALELLKGVVDVWLPDFKFGNDACAQSVAGIEGYTSIVRRNLDLLRDERHVVVRHAAMPGHDFCCMSPVRDFITRERPNFLFHLFPIHRPPNRRSV